MRNAVVGKREEAYEGYEGEEKAYENSPVALLEETKEARPARGGRRH